MLLAALPMLVSCLLGTAGLAADETLRPELIPSRGLFIDAEDAEELMLMGLLAKTEGGPVPTDVVECFELPESWTWTVEDSTGQDVSATEAPAATGDRVCFAEAGGAGLELTAVVWGDVLGTGTLTTAQVTAMARALTKQDALAGPYGLAADLNGSGSLDISDFTIEAQLLAGGGDLSEQGYPSLAPVAQAAYLLNPRSEGEISVDNGKVVGPLAETVLNTLTELHAKWADPDAPQEGRLADPANYNPLLLDVLTTCEVKRADGGGFEYSFETESVVMLLNALLGVDTREALRGGVETMDGEAVWKEDRIGFTGVPYSSSVVTYSGIGRYPSLTNTYEFESRLPAGVVEGSGELIPCLWYTAQILPDEQASFGFLVASCRFTAATD